MATKTTLNAAAVAKEAEIKEAAILAKNPAVVDGKLPVNKKAKNKRFILKKFELSVSLAQHSAGSVIILKCHKTTGIPIVPYWRRRFADSKIDNCMKVYIAPKAVEEKVAK